MRKDPFKQYSESTRRDFVKGLAKTCLGVEVGRQGMMSGAFSALSSSSATAAESIANKPISKPVTSIINIYLYGGLSHTDSFNAKETGKPIYDTIQTVAEDTYFSKPLEKLAKIMNKGTVIHSMNSKNGGHPTGEYEMFTSYQRRPDIVHPVSGSWISKLAGKANPELPAFISIGGGGRRATAGWLGAQYTGALVSNPEKGLKNIKQIQQLNDEQFSKQYKILSKMNSAFYENFPQQQVASNQTIYDEAIKTMQSDDLVAFDLNQESAAVKEKYGKSGRGCLLAARLAEAKVRFINVSYGFWDHHADIENRLTPNLENLATSVEALITDLERRGILESTLVVVSSEMGRRPGDLSINKGREHHPGCWSQLVFGGPVKQGFAYGRTNAANTKVEQNPVGHGDMNATLAYAMGINHDQILYSPSGRPFKIGGKKGKPITDIFA